MTKQKYRHIRFKKTPRYLEVTSSFIEPLKTETQFIPFHSLCSIFTSWCRTVHPENQRDHLRFICTFLFQGTPCAMNITVKSASVYHLNKTSFSQFSYQNLKNDEISAKTDVQKLLEIGQKQR